MSRYFPFFTNIEGQSAAVIGGGEKAMDKIQKLLPYGPEITVIAASVLDEIRLLQENGCLRILFTEEPIPLACLSVLQPAFVIQEDSPGAKDVFAFCRENRIPINTIDKKELCSFIFPASINRPNLTIAISTEGASPAAAVRIRKNIENALPDSIDEILLWLHDLRPVIKSCGTLPKEKMSAVFRRLTEEAFEKNRPLTDAETKQILEKYMA